MSKFGLSKTSAIIIGLSILAASAGTIFAQDQLRNTTARPEAEIKPVPPVAMREKLASKEAILRTKLKAFRDQKKASAAARINTNLNQINQNQTAQMQKYLDTMSGILDKLEARVNQPTPDIKDPVAAKAAIASARTVIATSSAAVSAQAQKDYTIQVTTESRIKADAQSMRDKLHTDILALRKIVIDAKQAVANVIRVAKSGSAAIKKEGTESGQQ